MSKKLTALLISVSCISNPCFAIETPEKNLASTEMQAKTVSDETNTAEPKNLEASAQEESDETIGSEVKALSLIAMGVVAITQRNNSALRLGSYRNTAEGNFLTEYNYNSMLSSINPLSLNDYGYAGSGINVAVVDSGIDASHQEFDDKIILGYDFGGSSSGFQGDEEKHGTHVASIIAGDRDEIGMRGVAYDANLF